MDLGLVGKTAFIGGSSKGLGLGCALALAGEGVNVVMNGRNKGALEEAAMLVRAKGVEVETVACDIATEEGRDQLYAAATTVDILITNAGGPPPGNWSDWTREDVIAAIDANMLSPIALMQNYLPKMIESGWGRVINITSFAVKAPIPHLGLSNTARAGLTGFVAGTARQIAKHGVTINNLLPGIHDTERGTMADRTRAAKEGIAVSDARAIREAAIPAGRFGTTEEFGAMCAFLCSQHAGFIVGQNIVLDGGAVNSTI
jgi:3-oxoacyl-[acyl-carrier protein] reductase